jgi:hypothetical protein
MSVNAASSKIVAGSRAGGLTVEASEESTGEDDSPPDAATVSLSTGRRYSPDRGGPGFLGDFWNGSSGRQVLA